VATDLILPPMAEGGRQKEQTSGWYTLLGVLIVLVVAAALVLAVRAVFSLLASASLEVFAAVIVTSGTILVSVGSLILSNRSQAHSCAPTRCSCSTGTAWRCVALGR
jgi:hypothetical protein